jgi:hypothetical protein
VTFFQLSRDCWFTVHILDKLFDYQLVKKLTSVYTQSNDYQIRHQILIIMQPVCFYEILCKMLLILISLISCFRRDVDEI